MKNSVINIVSVSKAFSDNARVKILSEIARRKSITCNEVIKITGLSQPTVSHHLKILVDAGLLNAVKNGRFSVLTINSIAFAEYKASISGIIKE